MKTSPKNNSTKGDAAETPPPAKPLTPRPGLLVLMAVVLVLLLAGLLALYFKTVYPNLHNSPRVEIEKDDTAATP